MKEILNFTIQLNNIEDQLMEEIRIQSILSHPHILTLYYVFSDSKKKYIALEYGEQNLLQKLQEKL